MSMMNISLRKEERSHTYYLGARWTSHLRSTTPKDYLRCKVSRAPKHKEWVDFFVFESM